VNPATSIVSALSVSIGTPRPKLQLKLIGERSNTTLPILSQHIAASTELPTYIQYKTESENVNTEPDTICPDKIASDDDELPDDIPTLWMN
jgi:hypothetical protein